MTQLMEYYLDLIKLEGTGEFVCPCCGVLISPDDETEEVYSILEAKVRDNVLENLMIRCNSCGVEIMLAGFSILESE